MKFTEEQIDLLAFLPQELRNTKELTDSSKLVLGDILFLYGMEETKKNGYVFRSYDDLMKDTLIKSKTSISKAIALLVQKEYIKVNNGRMKERKANEFTLINGTLFAQKCTVDDKKCTEKCTPTNEKCTLTEYWVNKIESLENEIVLLKKEIEELKKCTDKKCTVENEKCTTESDTDIETDIDKENNNTSILEHKDLVHIVTEENKKEKNNKKEKVNEMKNGVLNEMKLEDKTTSTQVHPSSIIDYRMSGVSDKNIYIPKNTVISSILPSKDDMDIDAYTSMNLEKRGLSSSVKANKATGGVENTSMDNLFTSVEKTQPDAKEVAKTQNKAYSLQEWMTEYKKLLLQVENTDVEDYSFISILDAGVNLFESFPKNEGSYQRAMQDLRYWVAKKLDFKKSLKISEHWNQYYRNI